MALEIESEKKREAIFFYVPGIDVIRILVDNDSHTGIQQWIVPTVGHETIRITTMSKIGQRCMMRRWFVVKGWHGIF